MAQNPSQRAFFKDISSITGMPVKVTTSYGKKYLGILNGFENHSLSVCLSDAQDEAGNKLDLLFIMGQFIQEILLAEKPFDLNSLAEEIGRLFPKGEVKLDHDARVIMVLNKVKVTEHGVEGIGPIAERVRQIYDKYIAEKAAAPKSE